MKLTIKLLSCTFFLFNTISYGQLQENNFKRELNGISDTWHRIALPNDIFSRTSYDLSDLRIFGVTSSLDTIEAPYLLRLTTEKTTQKAIAFQLLNTAHNANGYYFTFQIPSKVPVNRIDLDFKQGNFNWLTTLEGSHDRKEWFTILEKYRIVSIQNELTDFQFTKLTFPPTDYTYFRLRIDSKEKPELIQANIAQNDTSKGRYRNYTPRMIKTNHDKHLRQTAIEILLPLVVPVCEIALNIKDTFDYYRPLKVQYLADSTKTEQGWQYNYKTLTSGTLNSLEEPVFHFSTTMTKKLRILIQNQDNQPLNVASVDVKGYEHELIARFTQPATYFLTYGNQDAIQPQFDIDRFSDQIPQTLSSLVLGEEETIEKLDAPEMEPLFVNKKWLWVIMVFIIALLGWFSVKMIRKR
jgi:hypothetical protein